MRFVAIFVALAGALLLSGCDLTPEDDGAGWNVRQVELPSGDFAVCVLYSTTTMDCDFPDEMMPVVMEEEK